MNEFYNNWKAWQISRASQGKEKNRSFGQQLFAVFISVTIGTWLIHFVSFSAAVIFPAYQVKVLTGSPYVGFILGAVFIVVFIEIPKYVCINTAFENFFDSNIKSYGLAIVAFTCISTSILSSTYGIELAVKWLAPDAELLSIEQIEEKYDNLIQEEKQYWQPKVDKYDSESKTYFKANAKYYTSEGRTRLSSASSVRGPYNNMQASLTSAESSLNDVVTNLQEQKRTAIDKATDRNDSTEQTHEQSKSKASIISFWIMLVLELVYVFGIAYLAYYRDRSEKELAPPKEAKLNETSKVVDINSRTKPNQQEQPIENKAVASNQDKTNPIGFRTHGSVFVPDGGTVPKVWYQTTKGGWSAYSGSDLKRMIKKPTGSEEWKGELKGLVEKLEDFDLKNK